MISSAKIFFAMLPILFIAAVALQIPSYVKTAVSKTGRVIDADSGDGISGAIVFVKGLWHQTGAWQSPTPTCLYFEMLMTDPQGNFTVPSHYLKFEIGFPGRDAGHDWTIDVSKPGYISGDTELPLLFNASGMLSQRPVPWNSGYKDYQWNGLGIVIPPITLRQLDMTLEERVALFESRGSDPAFGCRFENKAVHDFLSNEKRSFYEAQEKYVCRASETSTTNQATVSRLWALAKNRDAFKRILKHIGPPIPGGDASFKYQLTDLCTAMKAGE